MPITRPVTKTKISTTEWGWPITDEVNALRTDVDALKSFPGAWAALTLVGGFVAVGGRCSPRCRKIIDANHVFIQFAIQNGSIAGSSIILNVPAGYRPSYTVDLVGRVGAAPGWFNINTDGNLAIYPNAGATNDFVAFTGVYTIQ